MEGKLVSSNKSKEVGINKVAMKGKVKGGLLYYDVLEDKVDKIIVARLERKRVLLSFISPRGHPQRHLDFN